MAKASYIALLSRRREGKTDYRTRKGIIISKENFLTFRISNKNTTVQLSSAQVGGDRILASAHSRELKKLGWRGSGKSIPAAYLTGLLAGQRASKAGLKRAIVYAGIKPLRPASRMAAAVKGVIEAGIAVPVNEKALPPEDRIKGEHISDYASSVGESGGEQFSNWKKSKLTAETFGKHYDEILLKIKGGK